MKSKKVTVLALFFSRYVSLTGNSICSLRELDICPLCGQSGGSAAGPYARPTERGLKSMDLAFKFRFFSLCFVPPYRSNDQGRGPKPGHSYWIKQIKSHKFITVLLSMCFCPKRAAKRHISSKVSVAELCISNGRQAIYRVPHRGTYRLKFIAGTISQFPG